MSRSRRKPQPNLPFAAAFALIQVLRDPGQRSEEAFVEPAYDNALTEGRKNSSFREMPLRFPEPYPSFETDYLSATVSKSLPNQTSALPGFNGGGEKR